MVSSRQSLTNSQWFTTYGEESGCEMRLFGFPYGGGGAGAFRRLAGVMPQDCALSAMVAPGRERRFREPGFTCVHELVEALLPQIEPLLDRPFAFLGHSVGALVAFELCRSLRAQGLAQPDLLCVMARIAPQSPHRRHDYYMLSGDALVEAVLALNRGSFGPHPDPSFIRAVEPQLQADFAITDTYRYATGPALQVPILAIGSADDPLVLPAELAAWQEQTTAAFDVAVLPDGGHFFLDHYAALILERIANAWAAIQH